MDNPIQPNGHDPDAVELELKQLVEEEIAALGATEEPAVETLIAELATRLRKHPDRAALLARLERESASEPGQGSGA